MKSIFEIQPETISTAPQQYIFIFSGWAEMTRTLINVVVCSHWGRVSLRRDQLILWSQAADTGCGPRWEALCWCQTTVHCTVHPLYCKVYSDSSLTAATQLSSAGPAAATTHWQGDTATAAKMQDSHWPAVTDLGPLLAYMYFSNFDEEMYCKRLQNRVQFHQNDTWKINGNQSEWTNSMINEMMCLLESIADKSFTLKNMNRLKSFWTYQYSIDKPELMNFNQELLK